MSAAAFLQEGHDADPATIREWMSGNICRCGAYPHIVDAVRDVVANGAANGVG
jgi:xanthine dehydrogenase YagT iron-sulfur-binding subunit